MKARSGLNDNHRRVLGSAFKHVDGLLVDIETAAANTTSPFARFRADLAPPVEGLLLLQQSPLAHVLTRSLGERGGGTPDVRVFELEVGDRLLLCCDGLTDMVSESDLEHMLSSVSSRDACCHRLVDAANDAGGMDNVTVLVVDVDADVDQSGSTERRREPDSVL